MANTMIPYEERNLTPDEVEQIDRRRRRGQAYLVIGLQTLLIALVMTLWSGQDLTYSPGWAHPVAYWNALVGLVSLFCLGRGYILKRGSNEFFSY